MDCNEILKRIDIFNIKEKDLSGNAISLSDKQLHLAENDILGRAEIDVYLSSESILFPHVDKNKIRWFKNNCSADNIIISNMDGSLTIHIFEIKKTIKKKQWEKIKEQFCGALPYAAGLLGIIGKDFSTVNVILYTIYANDYLSNPQQEDPLLLHFPINNESKKEWLKDKVNIDSPLGGDFSHKRIRVLLDPNDIMKGNLSI